MSFANWNLLDDALTLIPPTKVQYRVASKQTTTEFGQITNVYSEWKDAYGIVQPGGEHNEHTEGIDFSKSRVSIWLRGVKLTGTSTGSSRTPDQIRYVGRIYNVVSVDDWYPYDNYRKCDCVEATNNDETENSGENPSGDKFQPIPPIEDNPEVEPETEAAPVPPPTPVVSPIPKITF